MGEAIRNGRHDMDVWSGVTGTVWDDMDESKPHYLAFIPAPRNPGSLHRFLQFIISYFK